MGGVKVNPIGLLKDLLVALGKAKEFNAVLDIFKEIISLIDKYDDYVRPVLSLMMDVSFVVIPSPYQVLIKAVLEAERVSMDQIVALMKDAEDTKLKGADKLNIVLEGIKNLENRKEEMVEVVSSLKNVESVSKKVDSIVKMVDLFIK